MSYFVHHRRRRLVRSSQTLSKLLWWLRSTFVMKRFSFRVLASALAILTEIFVVLISLYRQIQDHKCFLLDPFQFIIFIQPTTRGRRVTVLNSCKKKPRKGARLGNAYCTARLQTRSNLTTNVVPKLRDAMLLKN
jgi:hypothetical protein